MRAIPIQTRFVAIEKSCNEQVSDIWFLTETHRDLSPCKGYFGIHSGTPDRLFKAGESWSSIWSKWPIETLGGYVSDASRCVAGKINQADLGEIILYGTVLPWNTDPRAKESSSYEAFAGALVVQKSDWLKIRRDFPNAMLIVAGDFNQDLVDKHFYGSKKKRIALESALKECELSPLTAGTNDPIARDSYPRANIDHIFMTSRLAWSVEKTSRWPESPQPVKSLSDHFGIKVEILSKS